MDVNFRLFSGKDDLFRGLNFQVVPGVQNDFVSWEAPLSAVLSTRTTRCSSSLEAGLWRSSYCSLFDLPEILLTFPHIVQVFLVLSPIFASLI